MERSDETEAFSGALPTLGDKTVTPTLQVLAGASAGMVFPLTRGETTLGRSDQCDIVLSDPGLSRVHARVLRGADGSVHVEDLGSTNGVTVEGNRLLSTHRLAEGERLGLGPTAVLKFGWQDEDSIELAARMYHGASKDNLTFALTRRQFVEQALQEDSLSRRYCVLLVDVDNLRRVNEAYSPQAGDSVVRGLVARVRGVLRPEDLVARFEGGLLGVMLRVLDPQEASTLAERMRDKVAATPFGIDDGSVSITVTIGMTDGQDYGRFPQALEGAEQALEEAKKQGRNRVYFARKR